MNDTKFKNSLGQDIIKKMTGMGGNDLIHVVYRDALEILFVFEKMGNGQEKNELIIQLENIVNTVETTEIYKEIIENFKEEKNSFIIKAEEIVNIAEKTEKKEGKVKKNKKRH